MASIERWIGVVLGNKSEKEQLPRQFVQRLHGKSEELKPKITTLGVARGSYGLCTLQGKPARLLANWGTPKAKEE